MQRILVIGPSGAGKSTLARLMGDRLGLPVVHLDQEFWLPGWIEPERSAWRARVTHIAAEPRWIIEGHYAATFDLRVPRAEAIVWLDLPRWIYFPRTIWRSARSYGRVRADMAPGCPERFDAKFLLDYVWRQPSTHRPATLALIEAERHRRHVVVLRSTTEVRRFVAGLPGSLTAAR